MTRRSTSAVPSRILERARRGLRRSRSMWAITALLVICAGCTASHSVADPAPVPALAERAALEAHQAAGAAAAEAQRAAFEEAQQAALAEAERAAFEEAQRIADQAQQAIEEAQRAAEEAQQAAEEGRAQVDGARSDAEQARLAAALAQVLQNSPLVTAEIIDDVVVLQGTVQTQTEQALLDQAVRELGLGVQNMVTVTDLSTSPNSLIELIEAQPELSTFKELLGLVDLDQTLAGDGPPVTVFVPTNDALLAMGTTLDELRAEPDRLRTFLLHHFVSGQVLIAEHATQPLESMAGQTLVVAEFANGYVANNSVPVLVTDIVGVGGVMHLIASPLAPGR